jgi:hypothetical protein
MLRLGTAATWIDDDTARPSMSVAIGSVSTMAVSGG